MNEIKAPPKFSVKDLPYYYVYSIQARSFSNVTNALRPYGIGTPTWRVLANLQEEDGISVRDLARRTTFDVSNLSKLINTMSEQGFVKKIPSKSDARVVLVYITNEGRELFETVLPAVREVQEQGLVNFTASERETLMKLLQRLMSDVSA